MDNRRKVETTLTVSIPLTAPNDAISNGQSGPAVLEVASPLIDLVDNGSSATLGATAGSSPPPSTVRRAGGSHANVGGAQSQLSKPVLAPAHVHCCPPEQWVPEAPVVNCMSPDCTNTFSLFNRKHRCRMCGRVFCSSCAANVVTVPASAIGVGRGGAVAAGADDGLAPITYTSASASGSYAGGSRAVPARGDLLQTANASYAGSASLAEVDLASANVPVSMRICNGCNYEMQLVVSTRREDGTKRRKSRGELKLFQKALVVNILSFLNLRDLAESSLVSSDFYFMSRDNVIWYQYNMLRWTKDAERTHKALVHPGYSIDQQYKKRLRKQQFEASSMIQDATALTESEAAKRVISLHARYNFTQFLDFTRRQEMARCEGMSSFSVGARVLCASPIKIAIIGPSRVGKTAAVRTFFGDNPQRMLVKPTIGFTRCTTSVRLTGGVATEVVLHIYDVSGESRYEALRRFICRQCHAIGLCYDPLQKMTLVQAADIMMGIEAELGPQPVVVCGLIRREALLDAQRRIASAAAAAPPTPSPSLPLPRARSSVSLALSDTATQSSARPLSPGADASSQREAAGPHSPASGAELDAAETHATETGADGSCSASPVLSLAAVGSRGSLDSRPTPTAPTTDPVPASLAASPAPSVANHTGPATSAFEVTEQDAVDITVRGRGSLQCDVLEPAPFFQMLIQSLLSRLVEATMVPTATVAEISREISTNRRSPGTPQDSLVSRNSRVTATSGRPRANVAAAQELLNITMQPSALDILVDR